MITYLQAIILGLLQGVTELFPISSLGHSVLIANLFHWDKLLSEETANESGFLAFLVVLHVATAIALIIFYRAQWVRIIKGFFRTLKSKRLDAHDADARLAWLLVAATIPAGLVGLIFEHALRTQFAKPFFAILFLFLNGILLFKGDRLVKRVQVNRKRQRKQVIADDMHIGKTSQMVSDHLNFTRAMLIGVAQVGALFAGISRSGITMLAGVRSGLNHQDAARFSFLLATPIILAAGIYKAPDFLGANGNGVRGQALVGAVVAGIAAYFTVKYLDRYFVNRSLRPFGIYCMAFAVFMLLLNIYRGA